MGRGKEGNCREIFVKAICARGQKADEQIHTIKADVLREAVEEVLGCRNSSHRYQTAYGKETVTIQGEYEVQVWVAYQKDSELIRDRVSYSLVVPLQEVGDGVLAEQPEVQVDVLEGPHVVEFGLDKEGSIEVVTGLQFRVAVFGEARLLVQTCSPADGLADDDFVDHWDWVAGDGVLPSSTQSQL